MTVSMRWKHSRRFPRYGLALGGVMALSATVAAFAGERLIAVLWLLLLISLGNDDLQFAAHELLESENAQLRRALAVLAQVRGIPAATITEIERSR